MKLNRYPKYKDSGIQWIGEIPEGWEVRRLKYITKFQYGTSLSEEDRTEGVFLVYGSNGVIGTHNKVITKEPCIIIGRKGSFGKLNFSYEKSFPIDTTYFIDSTYTNNDIRWIFYLLQPMRLDEFSRDAAVPGLNREEVYEKIVPLPRKVEQKQIASFLDKKTLQINKTIQKDKQLIELLKEKRNAVINQATTKGLDPNVKTKNSGIDWIGEIPEDWDVIPLLKLLDSKVDYRGATPEKVDDGIFLITAKNIKEGKIDYDISQEFVPKDQYHEIMHRGLPQKGDLLFTTEAPLGEVANVENTNIALAQRIIKMAGKKSKLDNYYLKYFIMSALFQGHLHSHATGSTALGIKASNMCYLRLLIPPFKDQSQIVQYLDKQTSKIEKTIKKIERKIELLEEYKKSLIHYVITGKIDVRSVQHDN